VIVPPWLVFLLIVSLALALGYQLASRRFGWRLAGYWLLTFLAVTACEALAESMGWDVTRLGDLRLAPDLAGGALAIAVLWFLGI
jgi:hypothetical protein